MLHAYIVCLIMIYKLVVSIACDRTESLGTAASILSPVTHDYEEALVEPKLALETGCIQTQICPGVTLATTSSLNGEIPFR
jgi:hypothetical protein